MSSFDDHGVDRITSSPRTRTTGLVGLLMALLLLAAACGSGATEEGLGSQESDPATSTETSGSDAATTTVEGSTDEDTADGDSDAEDDATERAEVEGYAIAFSSCMRDQGVDIPNLEINADGSLDVSGLVQNVDTQDPAVQQALLVCQDSLGGKLEGALAQFLTSETFDNVLIGFSNCVRDGGYTVKDLTLQAIVGAMLSSGPGPDPKGVDGSFAPIAANAMGLDPADADVLSTIDGCAAEVEAGLADLDLGTLMGDG